MLGTEQCHSEICESLGGSPSRAAQRMRRASSSIECPCSAARIFKRAVTLSLISWIVRLAVNFLAACTARKSGAARMNASALSSRLSVMLTPSRRSWTKWPSLTACWPKVVSLSPRTAMNFSIRRSTVARNSVTEVHVFIMVRFPLLSMGASTAQSRVSWDSSLVAKEAGIWPEKECRSVAERNSDRRPAWNSTQPKETKAATSQYFNPRRRGERPRARR